MLVAADARSGSDELTALARERPDRVLPVLVDLTGPDGPARLVEEAVRAVRASLPHLLERAPSTIVTVVSVNSFLPDPGVIDYSAAKAALANLCKSLSKEFGPRGIRVNTVSPGPVETDLWLGEHGVAATVAGAGSDAASVVEQQAGAAPTGRFSRPEEVADVVALLASGRAGNIAGADVVTDGGLVSTL